VYRFPKNEEVNLDRSDRIIALTPEVEFTDVEANKFSQCTYVVTTLDRTWNESKPSNEVSAERQ